MKGFCRKCGLWLNVHDDGKCGTCHYGHEDGRPYPTAPTPEAVAREVGGTNRKLVDVAFAPQTGDYADALRREADVALERAENEPILGKMTGKGREVEGGRAIDRTGPEDPEEAAEAARANVEGMRRDAEQLVDPPKVSEIDVREAGNADLKRGLNRSDQRDDGGDDDARARRAARDKERAAEQERAAQPARARGAATSTRDSGKAGK
jgi:hypothetical protein